MTYLTAEEIAKNADHLDDSRTNRTLINRYFREQDESHLYPVRGRFNVTEMAIARARRFMSASGQDLAGLEYAYFLETEIGRIVNDPRNF